MPYMIVKDGDQYCVHKEVDGKPGETVKCHPTEEEAKAHMEALYAAMADEKTLSTETLIHFGNAVKALGDGKVGGYLVTFGGLDLTGDYFSNQTDFGEYSRLPVLYQHGFDDHFKTKRIGTAEVKQDEVGLWAEAQLQLRDEYERMVYELAMQGKIGWSSGAASHTVQKSATKDGNYIGQWYMAEASLTPTPAEPRNSVITLKTYLGDTAAKNEPEGNPETAPAVESEGAKDATKNEPTLKGVNPMEITPEIQAVIDAGADAAVKKYRESEPATKAASLVVTKDAAEQPFETAGKFFMAVKNAALYPAQTDQRLLPLKATGMNEAIPSQGGFLLPQEVSNTIIEKVYNTGTLLSQFPRIQVEGNSMTFNVIDETSRADGSRYGGLRGYWLAEAASMTTSKPAIRQLELKLKKVGALVYATDEMLEDVRALESWISNTVPQELRFCVEDALINGSGAGMPLGILNSPALVSATRVDATQIDAYDIGNMWGRRYAGANDYVWLGNPGIFQELLNLTVGTTPVFLPAGGLSGLPYATLLGRPYFDTEYNPTLGEIGDLLLVSPSAYPIIEKAGGIKSESSIHVAFTSGEQVFRFIYRIDGAPAWKSSLTGNDAVTRSPFVSLTTST